MSIKKVALFAVMLALGMVLHAVVPSAVLGGMKMDFLLGVVFVSMMYVDNRKEAIMLGIAGGILSAMTTTFPGGQLPNIIDKIVTVLFVYELIDKIFKKKINDLTVIVSTILGTVVSGVVFLLSAQLILGGLPMSFHLLVLTVVLPATLGNLVLIILLYHVVKQVNGNKI